MLVGSLLVDSALGRWRGRGLLFIWKFSVVYEKLYVYLEVVPLGIRGNCDVPLALPLFVYRADKRMIDVDTVVPRICTGRQDDGIAGDFLERPLRVSVYF